MERGEGKKKKEKDDLRKRKRGEKSRGLGVEKKAKEKRERGRKEWAGDAFHSCWRLPKGPCHSSQLAFPYFLLFPPEARESEGCDEKEGRKARPAGEHHVLRPHSLSLNAHQALRPWRGCQRFARS